MTYVYARASGGVLGYRLNSDGSLTAISGSAFSIPGNIIAAAGAHLFSAAQAQVLVYGIDSLTGALTSQAQAAVPGAGLIAAVNGFVYVTGTNSAGDFAVYGFSVAPNGALAPIPGSPFFVSGVCELCVSPESIAAGTKYLAVGEGGGPHSAGGFILFARGPDGALQRTSGFGGSSVVSLALNQAGTVVYAIQSSDSAILVDSIDAAGQLTQIQYEYEPDFFLNMDLDPAGPYLVATTSPNGLVSYQLAADGGLAKRAFSLPITPSSAASTAVFDPSGRFVVLVEPAGLSVYSFNQTNGAMNQVGAAAASSAAGRAVMVTF